MAEERERQRAEIRAKQEERKAEQEAKRREWELAQSQTFAPGHRGLPTARKT